MSYPLSLPQPPKPRNGATLAQIQQEFYDWATQVVARMQSYARAAATPVAPFVATSFSTATVAQGQNKTVTIVLPITITGVSTGTATITTTATTTATLSDAASANVLATLVQDMITAGLLAPTLSL